MYCRGSRPKRGGGQESREIAATFESNQVTGDFHQAAAELYRAIGETRLGSETPESVDPNRTLLETVALLAEDLPMFDGE